MANRYWVGGTGDWDASTTTHWSSTSGGSGGSSVPSTTDYVFIDSNSGSGIITLQYSPTVLQVKFTNYAGTLNTNNFVIHTSGRIRPNIRYTDYTKPTNSWHDER